MIQKIVTADKPSLREKSTSVKVFDKKIKVLANNLLDTLKAQKDPEGIGLAGSQIGKNLCIFAMKDGNKFRIIINPEIIKIARQRKKENKPEIMEGCLSIPHYYGPLLRPQNLTLKYQDINGKINTEVFKNLSAQIIQHEIDHLNGILFTDHLIKQKKSLYKHNPKNDDWEEVDL